MSGLQLSAESTFLGTSASDPSDDTPKLIVSDPDAPGGYRDVVVSPAADAERPSRSSFCYTCLETADHKQLITEANEMGGRGWEMIDVELNHGFWLGFFKREVIEDNDDAEPVVQNRMPGGVLDLCGGV